MNKGLIIECGSCGFLKFISLEGKAEEIESRIHETIETEGWRYVKSWDGYICPDCRKNGTDKLYESFVGKPKVCRKKTSYEHLLNHIVKQLRYYKEIERW